MGRQVDCTTSILRPQVTADFRRLEDNPREIALGKVGLVVEGGTSYAGDGPLRHG